MLSPPPPSTPPAPIRSVPLNVQTVAPLKVIGTPTLAQPSIDSQFGNQPTRFATRTTLPNVAKTKALRAIDVPTIAQPSINDRRIAVGIPESVPLPKLPRTAALPQGKAEAKLLGQPLSIDLRDVEFLTAPLPNTQAEPTPQASPEFSHAQDPSLVQPLPPTSPVTTSTPPATSASSSGTVKPELTTIPVPDVQSPISTAAAIAAERSPPPELSAPTPAAVQTPNASLAPLAQVPEGFTVFPVGINIGRRTVNTGVSVRGREGGTQAVAFDQWLLPYDAIVQALKLSTKVLPDNQIELRSSGVVVRLDPAKLHTDPRLGLVLSVQEVRSLFGLQVEFNVNEYAIQLDAPWLEAPTQSQFAGDAPVVLEGLPQVAPPDVALTAIEQRVNISGAGSSPTASQGDLTAVGSLLGGSLFLRADQPKLLNPSSWRLADALWQRQTDKIDFFVGTQPSFWRALSPNDYVGFTVIQRQGYTPPPQLYGDSDPRQRLQAAQVGRTVSGRAAPGTLVRLVKGFSDRVIAETLVDSSGVYRFENIKLDTPALGGYYQVFLYPQGQLTAAPEIRDATFTTLPGQLPGGTSALILSGGVGRDARQQGFLGDFSTFRGGAAQRWGVSNSLTLGAGVVYDQSLRGLAEFFWQPETFPFKAAVSVLSGTRKAEWDVNADVSFDPSPTFSARFTHDRFSSRLNAYWQVARGVTLLGSTDSRDATAAGVQVNFSGQNAFTFARLTVDTKRRLRWNLLQRLGRLELSSVGNEISTQSSLSYFLTRHSDFNTGHSFSLGYETYNAHGTGTGIDTGTQQLATLSWRYRSPKRSIDGTPLWEAQLGYGVGSQGAGVLASVGTTLIPGILLRARYQGVSVTSDDSSFGVELVSGLNFQGGINPGDRQAGYLRTQGGIMVQPFLDRNHNGKRDPGEAVYTDPNLVIVNNQAVSAISAQVESDRIRLRLLPSTYRLDLDAAGLPPDWQAATTAYAVKVVAGSYTTVAVPLIPSYTLSGVVTDGQGKPLSGVRVEAIPEGADANAGQRLLSVTNDAGVYFLEHLRQSAYTLQVNGKTMQPGAINLTEATPAFQELNLQPPTTAVVRFEGQ